MMAYDTLVRAAKELSEDMIEQVIDFMRFLKYTSRNAQTNHSINKNATFQRSFSPLADEFVAIAEDFDENAFGR